MSKPAPKRKARNRNRGVLAYQQLPALVDEGIEWEGVKGAEGVAPTRVTWARYACPPCASNKIV